MARLESNPLVAPIASESRELGREVRHIMFRTRVGRAYRALFVTVGEEVQVLRIRGPGQRPLSRKDIDLGDERDEGRP